MNQPFGLLLIILLLAHKAEAQSLPLPYYSGFDSPSENTGWTQFRLGAMPYDEWKFREFAANPSQPNCIWHHYNTENADTIEDWYVSPPFNISSRAKISFYINLSLAGNYDPIKYIGLWIGSEGNNPSIGNFTELANLTNMRPEDQWLDTTIFINKIADSSYLAFKYQANDDWFIVSIDNISITPDSGTFIINNLVQNTTTTLYPNPSNGTVTLTTPDALKTKSDLIIYNVLGLAVYSQVLNPKREVINLNLPDGIYIYKVFNKNEEIAIGKIILQRF